MSSSNYILIAGPPGIGKTTLVVKVAGALRDLHPVGFYTTEIREGGVRQGFELISFNGTKALLSHVNIHKSIRTGRYGVDVNSLDSFLRSYDCKNRQSSLVIIDEIGEIVFSLDGFTVLVHEALDSVQPVIATIALKGGGFIDEVRRRNDIGLIEFTHDNRDSLIRDITQQVRLLIDERLEEQLR